MIEPIERGKKQTSSKSSPSSRANIALLVGVVVALVGTACIPRDTSQIALAHEETFAGFGTSWELDYYVNGAYDCGLTGNYSFLVMNPAGNPDATAPLWVYLHGGGVGYYDDQGDYKALTWQNENTWQHQETFDGLFETHIVNHTIDENGQPIDQTVKRRVEEGYRVLVVSYCDQDLYSGLGSTYPNHPTNPDAQVNGLQATMAAIDYAAANYPTTHVWAHDTSAGSIGVWSLASSYGQEGTALTGVVADSSLITPRRLPISAALNGQPGYPFPADFDPQGVTDKVQFFADPDVPAWPEAQIVDRDFRSVPVLFIHGLNDPFCGGNQSPIPEAAAEGLSNCAYLFDGLHQAIDGQTDTPHEIHALPSTGHVPTNKAGPANDIVDDFINTVLATNPPNFGAS